MSRTKSKNKAISIRINETDLKTIDHLASAAGMNRSSYMCQKSLSANSDLEKSLRDTVKSWNLLNEIYHETQKSNDTQLKHRIHKLLSVEDTK